jgi:hypothetical protein
MASSSRKNLMIHKKQLIPRSLYVIFAVFLTTTTHTLGIEDLITPRMTEDLPGPGKRVRQVAPKYQGTDVYHSLYLPQDWEENKKYPVLVEYTGNRFEAAGSSGEVKDANFGYGLSGGKQFIWICMPYIKKGGKENEVM